MTHVLLELGKSNKLIILILGLGSINYFNNWTVYLINHSCHSGNKGISSAIVYYYSKCRSDNDKMGPKILL